jgi:hypothetical protein
MDFKRELTIANFNCTYGEDNLPMLQYFDEIVFPTFTNDLKRITKDNDEYFFEGTKIIQYKKDEFALTGLFVKKTIVEIKSGHDVNKGVFDENINVPSAPYSIFIIFLNNHRMILLKNQRKDSPDIRSFSTTVKEFMNKTVIQYNKTMEKEDKLPLPYINIASVPSKGTIEKQLIGVKSITNLTLRFYPLNGDVDDNEPLRLLRGKLDVLNSKTGNTVINSPKNIPEVVEFINDTRGNAVPSLRVSYENGDKRTIKDDEFAEKITVLLGASNINLSDSQNIVDRVINRDEIREVSEENKVIYLNKFLSIKNKWKDGGQ